MKLISEGSTGEIIFGQQIKKNLVSGSATVGSYTVDGVAKAIDTTPYHLELFYRYQLSITAKMHWGFNPEGISNSATATVGLIRATFSF